MKKRNILIVLIVFMFIGMSAASAANTTYNTSSISTSAGKVQRYVENHQVIATKIPIDGDTITSSEFLYLLTKDVQNINQNTDTPITSMDVLDPTGPTETITTNGTLTLSEYTNAARKISVFIEKYGRAPNYVSTSLGNMQYENMIYTFSKIMNYYSLNNQLPETISVDTWSSITNTSISNETSETSYDTSAISKAAYKVKTYVENHNASPTSIPVDDDTVTSSQFLYLLTKDVQNVYNGVETPVTLMNVSDANKPAETLTSGTLTLSEYLKVARQISVYIEKYGRAPNYVSTSLGYMQYENMIYTFSKVMNFYRTYDRLPNTVSVATWSSITGTSTVVTSGGTVNFTDTSDTTTTQIGSDSNGYVLKIGPFGNASSTNKIAVIIGVHFQEGAAHLAMLNALKTLSSQLNNVQIWVYKVVITTDLDDYTLSREHGQDLASAFVVPDIDSSYKLVVDTHGNRGLYATNDFVFAPYEDSNSVNYANEIVDTTDYLKYFYVSGSSPDYVTIPIAKKGIASVVFELYLNVDKYNIVLYNKCLEVVEGLNTIFA